MDIRYQTLTFPKWEKKYEPILDEVFEKVMEVVSRFKGVAVYDGSLRDDLREYLYHCSNSRFRSFPHD